MATLVPQRDLRNNTAALLRRVEHGERLRITVHGHPIADLVPVEEDRPVFVPWAKLHREMAGLLDAGDELAAELRAVGEDDADDGEDAFERYERLRRK